MAGSGRNAVNFIKQDIPKFIQDFKKKTNQPAESTLDSKRNDDNVKENDEDTEREDEAPIISLSQGVSEEEAKEFLKASYGEESVKQIEKSNNKRSHEKEDDNENNEKVLFKKPDKSKKSDKAKSKMKKIKNSTLLSFGDDDDED